MTSTGWAASQSVSGTLHSDPVDLGALTADAAGIVNGAFVVPASTPPGQHELVLTGTDAAGAPRTVRAAVAIGAAAGTNAVAPAQVAGIDTARNLGATLPVTGAALARTAWLGSTLLGCGAMFTIASMRRRLGRP